MAKRIAKKIVWIGWDAADWKVINPMIELGYMPNLEKMINEGVMGNLATLDPPMSPTLWTAMSCGKRPYKHGIHGFTEIDPSGEGVRPCYVSSRKVKAIWNMMMQSGMKCHQVGWWPSHPAEPTNGIYVSNFFQKASKNPKNWPLSPGAVHPPEMSDTFADLRVHPNQLTKAHVAPFVTDLDNFDFNDKQLTERLKSIKKVTADGACIHNAATYILEKEKDFDLLCVYYDCIDHYCHGFMKYHPPRRPHIPEKLYRHFKDVVASGYRWHDMLLGRILNMVDDDTIVVLVSDHGFHPDHLRPVALPLKEEPAAPALEHSPYGIFVAKGPGIKKDERIYGASLIDMCPTMLAMLGLPIAKDFDGKILMNIFEEPVDFDVIDSWENVEGECGMHPRDLEVDPEQAKEEMQQLIDLGYIEDPGPNAEAAIERTNFYNKYFLARSFVNGGRHEDALPLFEEIWEEDRKNARFGVRLVNVYLALGKITEARKVVDEIFEMKLKDTPNLNVLSGTVYLKEKKYKKAVKEFEKAFKANPKMGGINIQLANGYHNLRMYKKAIESANRELEFNYENPEAHRLLGEIYLQTEKYSKSIESYLNCIGLKYHMPNAHLGLAKTLFKLEDYERSAQAAEVAVAQFPRFKAARNLLKRIYTYKLNQPEKLNALEEETQDLFFNRRTINVISSFKEGGDHELMHMLFKGGAKVVKDNEDDSDELHPNGHYTFSKTHDLHHNKSFLEKIDADEVLKVNATLLPFLPRAFNYKVVFIERDSNEILDNQNKAKTLKKKKRKGSFDLLSLSKINLKIERIQNWLNNREHLEFIQLDYNDLKNENRKEKLNEITNFLELDLDVEKMIADENATVNTIN